MCLEITVMVGWALNINNRLTNVRGCDKSEANESGLTYMTTGEE